LWLEVDGDEDLARLLDRSVKELNMLARRVMRGEGGQALQSELRNRLRALPYATGETASAVGIQDRGDAHGVYIGVQGNRAGIAKLVESGSRPHLIQVRRARALRIGTTLVREVHHPGAKPKRIASKALRSTQWEIEAALVDELNEVFPPSRSLA
jgi:hypothetical protein